MPNTASVTPTDSNAIYLVLSEPQPKGLIMTTIQAVAEATLAEALIAEPAAQPKAQGGRPVRGYIILGPRDVYTDAQVALKDIHRGPFSPLPENYHNKLTQTFRAGLPAGQIKSLFRDLKLYGPAIAPKLAEYASLVLNADWPADSDYVRYVSAYRAGQMPHDPATFVDGRVSMDYFKFWVLLSFTSQS